MVKRYQARFGEEPTVQMVEAYDAARILLTALKGSDRPTRETVRQAVAETRDFPGPSGNISFDEGGDIMEPEIGIYKFERGRLTVLGFTRNLLRSEAGDPVPAGYASHICYST